MKILNEDIKSRFYQVIYGELKIKEFESWIYAYPELETFMDQESYYELISFNYMKKNAKCDLEQLLFKYFIERVEYEKWKLLLLLKKALNLGKDLPYVLIEFYDLYYCGYNFLEKLALNYGLSFDSSYYGIISIKEWSNLDKYKRIHFVDKEFPNLKFEIKRVIECINNDKIVFKKNLNSNSQYCHLNYRSSQELKFSINSNLENSRVGAKNNNELEIKKSWFSKFIDFWFNAR